MTDGVQISCHLEGLLLWGAQKRDRLLSSSADSDCPSALLLLQLEAAACLLSFGVCRAGLGRGDALLKRNVP
jgi:hypothetical protein